MAGRLADVALAKFNLSSVVDVQTSFLISRHWREQRKSASMLTGFPSTAEQAPAGSASIRCPISHFAAEAARLNIVAAAARVP